MEVPVSMLLKETDEYIPEDEEMEKEKQPF